MSACRSSLAKTRRLCEQRNSLEVLHRGIKRKVSVNSYQKAFPRMKITTQTKKNPLILRQQPEEVRDELYRLKDENKRMEETNYALRTLIRKELKLNQIYEKRVGGG